MTMYNPWIPYLLHKNWIAKAVRNARKPVSLMPTSDMTDGGQWRGKNFQNAEPEPLEINGHRKFPRKENQDNQELSLLTGRVSQGLPGRA